MYFVAGFYVCSVCASVFTMHTWVGRGGECRHKPSSILSSVVVFFVQQEVMSASVSGNLDAPEGGFDAIMQAVACEVWQCC